MDKTIEQQARELLATEVGCNPDDLETAFIQRDDALRAIARALTRPAPAEAEVLAVQVLDLLRTGKDGRKFDCIESRAGALVNVAHFFGESK